MTNRFISTSGSNTSPFDTWAKAASSTTTGLDDVLGVAVAGDDIFMDKTMTISTTGADKTYTFPGTDAAPSRFFSATFNTGTSPSPGALVRTTGDFALAVGGCLYNFGVNWTASVGSAAFVFLTICNNGAFQMHESCTLSPASTHNNLKVLVGYAAYGTRYATVLRNVTIGVTDASNGIELNGLVRWQNDPGVAAWSGTAPNYMVSFSEQFSLSELMGLDLSGVTTGPADLSSENVGILKFTNCKFNAGYAFGAINSYPFPLIDVEVSGSAAGGYNQERHNYAGDLTTETTTVNNATDGVQAISWKIITSANSKIHAPFECFDIVRWVPAGTYAASKIQITSVTGSLTNADVWVDVDYLADASNFPITSLVTSGLGANLLTTPSGLNTGGAWATSPKTNQYFLAIPSFTSHQAGYVRFRVKVAKPSLTVYIDPAVTVA